jgi:hypothetical protein
MTRQEIDSAIKHSNTHAQLGDRLQTLAKRDREELIDRVIAQLDKRDAGYNRVLNRLLEIRKEG